MLWHEFIAGTGCRDTENNYQIYKDLEIMYMNSDMSKEKIYELYQALIITPDTNTMEPSF